MDYIGKQIGKYTIKRLIGEGGMASVFEGEHEILGTKAAIKILNPILSANKQIRERFKNEAKLMASLDHPNITRVLDFEENDSYLAIAMELLSGEDLSDRIKGQGKLTEKEIIHVFEQTLSAFEYAHNLGIVHRDIKPSNIFMLPNGTIKILDFGIAKLFGQGNEMTQTGTQMGTPIYMSPEQVKADKTVDHRSDIYSLGVTLYYALIGKPPYDGNTSSQFDIFTKIVHEPLPEIESTSYLADLIRKACQKDREQRFQSCDEWLQALKLGVAPKVETSAAEKTIIETPNVQSGDQTIIETSASSDNDKTELETNSQNARNNTDSKQPLGAPEAKNNYSNNQKKEGDNPVKKNKTWIIIALIVAVVGIGIGIFFMLNEKEGSKKEVTNDVSAQEVNSFEVTIGNQIWMTKNLNVDKFRNGDPIPEAKTDEEWLKAGKNEHPAWCYYDNDPKNGEQYGKLYNWFAVNDPRGLAPNGWHIPKNKEWDLLISELESKNDNVFQLQFGGGLWEIHFTGISEYGVWWSRSLSERADRAVCYGIVNGNWSDKNERKFNGYSIRCVKD
jgi:serine/threonine protein kinase